MSDADLTETRLDQVELFKGHFLHAFCDRVQLPDGQTTTREYLVHPGAAMIIALTDDGQVVLERQFRYPVGQVMIEFPAGKLDPGESSWACARRELLEETGFRAREWARAAVIHPVISYSTEFIEIWFARGLVRGAARLDEGEFLEVFTASADQLMTWCATGQVSDAKTLSGALWLQNVLAGRWSLAWQDDPDTVLPG